MKTNFRIKNTVVLFTLTMFCLNSCNTEELGTHEADLFTSNLVAGKGHGKVLHHVNLGSNDVCTFIGQPNGCDANFSLVANLYADGFVTGQWQDSFSGDGEGIHVVIDCANFGDGPNGISYAIVSGIITKGTILGQDVTGQRATTFAADHGPGSQEDYMSFSILPGDIDCNLLSDEDAIIYTSIIPLITGEVVVW
ncbi:hypothetical protein [Aestuariivivens sediminis]|uniref:hypothetical protein n=1 Tax=Aestuariivivens sediminis TaxID=2913557 RepID=UPI001F5774E0|nr:hypothetical protein [Aestuariivivens sediminis]